MVDTHTATQWGLREKKLNLKMDVMKCTGSSYSNIAVDTLHALTLRAVGKASFFVVRPLFPLIGAQVDSLINIKVKEFI